MSQMCTRELNLNHDDGFTLGYTYYQIIHLPWLICLMYKLYTNKAIKMHYVINL